MVDSDPALQLVDVAKEYPSPAGPVAALDGVSLSLSAGSFTAVMGPSGSGKSTMLHCSAALTRPTRGQVLLAGTRLDGLSESRLTRLRRTRVGFVFQAYNLVPALTVQDNITLPLRLASTPVDRDWARTVVDRVGLGDLLHRRPAELSGGQQQRVAVARALVTRPDLIMADEPTGALDSRTGATVLTLLRDAVDSLGQTVLMVTHDANAAATADRVLLLVDGRLLEVIDHPDAVGVADRMARLEVAPG